MNIKNCFELDRSNCTLNPLQNVQISNLKMSHEALTWKLQSWKLSNRSSLENVALDNFAGYLLRYFRKNFLKWWSVQFYILCGKFFSSCFGLWIIMINIFQKIKVKLVCSCIISSRKFAKNIFQESFLFFRDFNIKYF